MSSFVTLLRQVLILVVVEDGLVLYATINGKQVAQVLILVVVEDGLVRYCNALINSVLSCLNPCCSGRWSRTELGVKL